MAWGCTVDSDVAIYVIQNPCSTETAPTSTRLDSLCLRASGGREMLDVTIASDIHLCELCGQRDRIRSSVLSNPSARFLAHPIFFLAMSAFSLVSRTPWPWKVSRARLFPDPKSRRAFPDLLLLGGTRICRHSRTAPSPRASRCQKACVPVLCHACAKPTLLGVSELERDCLLRSGAGGCRSVCVVCALCVPM